MTQDQFNEITLWQRKTFPAATSEAKVLHLQEEVIELLKEVKFSGGKNNMTTKQEIADCILLIYGAADSIGMTYNDILVAIRTKMIINKERKWSKPDAKGISHHI